jgi:molybdate-binding protein
MREPQRPVNLPKMLLIMTTRVSANHVTIAMILNITKIRIKNNTTVMVSDMLRRHKLYGQIGNKRNIRDMKRVRRKSAMSSNRKKGIHLRYEQCNIGKVNVKKKDKQNEESYGRKHQN